MEYFPHHHAKKKSYLHDWIFLAWIWHPLSIESRQRDRHTVQRIACRHRTITHCIIGAMQHQPVQFLYSACRPLMCRHAPLSAAPLPHLTGVAHRARGQGHPPADPKPIVLHISDLDLPLWLGEDCNMLAHRGHGLLRSWMIQKRGVGSLEY